MTAKYDEVLEYKLKYLWKHYELGFGEEVSFHRYVTFTYGEFSENKSYGDFPDDWTFNDYVDSLIDEYEHGELRYRKDMGV